jgi:hypothetical protein
VSRVGDQHLPAGVPAALQGGPEISFADDEKPHLRMSLLDPAGRVQKVRVALLEVEAPDDAHGRLSFAEPKGGAGTRPVLPRRVGIEVDPVVDPADKVPADYASLDMAGLVGNLVPVTLGNIVGGTVLVGAVYWLVYLRGKR